MKKFTYLALVTAAFLELISSAALHYFPAPERKERETADKILALQRETQSPSFSDWLLHPYLGFVLSPEIARNGNNLGFPSPFRYPYKRAAANEIIIGVLGGSVAVQFTKWETDRIQRHFESFDPSYRDKRFTLVSLAVHAYKQPQQLNAFALSLLYGFDLDFVINLDGFNEIAGMASNGRDAIDPLYPFSHYWGMVRSIERTMPDPERLDLIARFRANTARQQWWLRMATSAPFRHSSFLTLLAARLDHLFDERGKAFQENLSAPSPSGASAAGPMLVPRLISVKMDEQIGRVWADSSRMIGAIAASHHIPYLHLLQPSLLITGTKPLAPVEREILENFRKNPGEVVKAVSEEGYNRLYKRYRQLGLTASRDEEFHDLSGIFRSQSRPLYEDVVHFNLEGHEILAKELVRLIAPYLKKPPYTARTKVEGPRSARLSRSPSGS